MRRKRTQRTDNDDILSLLDISECIDCDPCTEPREGHARSLDMTQCLRFATQRGQWDLDKPKSNANGRRVSETRVSTSCVGMTPRIERGVEILTLQMFHRRRTLAHCQYPIRAHRSTHSQVRPYHPTLPRPRPKNHDPGCVVLSQRVRYPKRLLRRTSCTNVGGGGGTKGK